MGRLSIRFTVGLVRTQTKDMLSIEHSYPNIKVYLWKEGNPKRMTLTFVHDELTTIARYALIFQFQYWIRFILHFETFLFSVKKCFEVPAGSLPIFQNICSNASSVRRYPSIVFYDFNSP